MITDWHNLYKEGWQGEITPEAFSHPAKYSRALIRKIYQHAFDEGWLAPGDQVIDPFGGVALGGLDAAMRGLHWTGMELEPRFVALGQQNIDLWQARYAGKLPRWGSAQLLEGDSRRLCFVLAEQAGAISSPPYADGCAHTGGDTPTSEPFITGGKLRGVGIDGVLSSPPYAESLGNGEKSGIDWGKQADRDTSHSHGYNGETYGSTPGQLGAMKAGEIAKQIVEVNQIEETVTFWFAAREIVDQVYMALRPGAHAIWVVKGFVRNKQYQDFPAQWRQLCEAAGFTPLHEHRAWLVEHKGTQLDLEGNGHTKTVERKSFFRRLAEKKGSPRIDYEVVLCMVKP